MLRQFHKISLANSCEGHKIRYIGLADAIISDNPKSLTSRVFKEICRKLNIDYWNTIPYILNLHQSERVHKNWTSFKITIKWQSNIEGWLSCCYNTSNSLRKSTATNFSPYYFIFPRSPRIGLDIRDKIEFWDKNRKNISINLLISWRKFSICWKINEELCELYIQRMHAYKNFLWYWTTCIDIQFHQKSGRSFKIKTMRVSLLHHY